MSDGFDPYYKWLGIPPTEQPPNHYRLLGLTMFETDGDVIEAAADRQMGHVRTYKFGPHGDISERLLNELSIARISLLDARRRAAYDEGLQSSLAPVQPVPTTPNYPAAQVFPIATRIYTIASPPLPQAPVHGSPPVEAYPAAEGYPAQPPLGPDSVVGNELQGKVADPLGVTQPHSQPRRSAKGGSSVLLWAGNAVFAALGLAIGLWILQKMKPVPAKAPGPVVTVDPRTPTTDSGQHSKLPSPPEPVPATPIEPSADVVASIESHTPAEEPLPQPETSGATHTIDLLAKIDLKRDAVSPEWRQEAGELIGICPGGGLFQFPLSVRPESYVLTAELVRVEGDNVIGIGLMCGDRRVLVTHDWIRGDKFISGLHSLAGRGPDENATTTASPAPLIPRGELSRIVCRVQPGHILVLCNDRKTIDWHGSFADITPAGGWQSPDPLAYTVGVLGTVRFTKLEIRPIESDATGAVVTVARMKPQQIASTESVPLELHGGIRFEWIEVPTAVDVELGMLEFKVAESGAVYLAADWHDVTRLSRGPWWDEHLNKEQLVELGWQSLGPCRELTNEGHVMELFRKNVTKGETYRIRVSKYWPPSLFVPSRRSDELEAK